MNPRVLIESPFAGGTRDDIQANIDYAKAAVRDCLQRGEDPYASHLFFTQENILDDSVPGERERGIEAGLNWGSCAEYTVVYTDLGISPGMQRGIERAAQEGRPVEYRTLVSW